MSSPPDDNAALASAKREALLVGLVWLGALVYTTTYCCLYGYGRTAESLRFVLGVPDWVFWGIFVPWGVCLAFSVWFGLFFMRDEVMDVDEGLADSPAANGDPGFRAGGGEVSSGKRDAGGASGD